MEAKGLANGEEQIDVIEAFSQMNDEVWGFFFLVFVVVCCGVCLFGLLFFCVFFVLYAESCLVDPRPKAYRRLRLTAYIRLETAVRRVARAQ